MIRRLYYLLNPKLRFVIRYILLWPVDQWDYWVNGKKEFAPPKRLIFIGSGSFTEVGNLFLEDFQKKQIISSDSNLLDVGCGIGRMAIPLTRYLTQGKYEGFDIVKLGINWCKRHIESRFPNFKFTLVQVHNDLYTESGKPAKEFVFPYPDNYFDLVVVLSVFTHMVQDEVEHYLSEISRVLKPGGYCYSTFFILNSSSESQMQSGHHNFNFKYNYGAYSLISDKVKSANVAYQENYLLNELFPRYNFRLKSLEYGYWSNDKSTNLIDFQDRVVLQKNR